MTSAFGACKLQAANWASSVCGWNVNEIGFDVAFIYLIFKQLISSQMCRWAIVNSPITSDLVCTRRGDHSQTKITVSDHNTSLTTALLIKYALILLAAVTLPVIIFKVFILPFKILLGLKAISLLNSLLLGSLLLKYKFSGHDHHGGGGYPIMGTVPGSTTSSSSSSSSSAAANSLELRYYWSAPTCSAFNARNMR